MSSTASQIPSVQRRVTYIISWVISYSLILARNLRVKLSPYFTQQHLITHTNYRCLKNILLIYIANYYSYSVIHIRFFLIIKEPLPNYFALNIEKQFAATLKLKIV